jgi:imidazolonepropionase-like amidohydrolase
MMDYILKGRVVDPGSNSVWEKGLVEISKGEIAYAGLEADYPSPDKLKSKETRLIDVGMGTILPGFIDCHAHLIGHEDAGGSEFFGDQILGAAYQLGLLLESGFTGLRDMSEAGLYLSRAVDRGILRGPRIVPGGKVIGITGGHVDMKPSMSKEQYNAHDHLSRLADGIDDCILAVREQFRMGAKFIKICATGGVSSPTDRVDDVQFSPEELRAITGEAKRKHTYVCAHCTGNEGAYQALLAGVECIEHGVMLTQREIDLMAEKGATLVTTLAVSLGVAKMSGFPDWMREKAQLAAASNLKTIEMARKAGLRLALGTDYSNSKNTPFLKIGREFSAMIEAGLTPMEALKAGTSNAAYLMMNNRIGSLAPGMIADITVSDGNPLEDIGAVSSAERIKMVFSDGKKVKHVSEGKTA